MITQKAISDILKPLMATGVYKDEKRALKDIVADYVQRKIDAYDAVILRMEKKYGKAFEAFSMDIEHRASVAKEDDWMEWKAAITMKEAWRQAFKKLLRNAA
jgi:translation initiation factor 2 alpha subunit (eIF-2alpha)